MPCTKWTVFSLNLFFILFGLALLVGGTALLFIYQHHEHFSVAQIRSVPVIFMFIGFFSFIFALFGACGAVARSPCLTFFSSIVIFLFLMTQIEMLIFGALKQNEMSNFWNNSFNDMLKNHKSHEETWTFMQKQLECCGVNGPNDWINLNSTNLPASCCPTSHNSICTETFAFKLGCKQGLLDFFDNYSWSLFSLIIVIVLIQMLLFGLSCSLYGTYRKDALAYDMESTSF